MDWAKTIAKGDKEHINLGIWCDLCKKFSGTSDSAECSWHMHTVLCLALLRLYHRKSPQKQRLTNWPLGDLNVISKKEIFNLALLIGIFNSSYDNVLWWMPQDLTDDKSTLVQVMAWCRQAASHYLNQCWPRSPTPYGVTKPQLNLN